MGKIRITDVAALAGVSKSTVSQYLNGRFEYMSIDTKKRIQSSIKELNYLPNAIARSLKTNKTRTIGVIVRDITGYFTSRVIRGIDDYCKKHDYNVIIYNTDFNTEIEQNSINVLKQLLVDGIIIASSGKNIPTIAREISSGLPFVQMQLEYDGIDSSVVISEYRSGCFAATEYLIKLGHRRICFMTQDYLHDRSRNERFIGYMEALKKYDIPLQEDLIILWSREDKFLKSTEDILKMDNPPTAFFTMHLAITIDLLRDLKRLNVNIPDDVSVLGHDEMPLVDLLKVPITVVRQSPYDIGRESASLLINKIENIKEKKQKVDLAMLPMFGKKVLLF
jgi:DNA-binding LacI/PurR family transcriptional regulator